MPIVIGIKTNDPTATIATQSFQFDVFVPKTSSGMNANT